MGSNRPEHLIADPRFRDPLHGDFTLAPVFLALAFGFEPIDLSDVGPRPAGKQEGRGHGLGPRHCFEAVLGKDDGTVVSDVVLGKVHDWRSWRHGPSA